MHGVPSSELPVGVMRTMMSTSSAGGGGAGAGHDDDDNDDEELRNGGRSWATFCSSHYTSNNMFRSVRKLTTVKMMLLLPTSLLLLLLLLGAIKKCVAKSALKYSFNEPLPFGAQHLPQFGDTKSKSSRIAHRIAAVAQVQLEEREMKCAL